MKTIAELRKEQYSYNKKVAINEYGVNLDNWRTEPYTYLKARLYMELSAVLVYFLIKAKIKPNNVTLAYAFCGILGGTLLSIPSHLTIYFALIIFFFKGVLDWSDGHLARATNQTSLTGHILDSYGAHLNALGLQIGLGFYVAQKANFHPLFYLVPLIPFFYAARLTTFCYTSLFQNLNKETLKNSQSEGDIQEKRNSRKIGLNNIDNNRWKRYLWISSFLDDRARSVDFILLLILIELIYPSIFVTWLIFILLVIKGFIIFVGTFHLVAQKEWAERTLEEKLLEMKDDN